MQLSVIEHHRLCCNKYYRSTDDIHFNFRRWSSSLHVSPSPVRRRVRKLKFSGGFPSQAVVDAYLNPDVDHSTENFSWADPNLDALRAYPSQWRSNGVNVVPYFWL